MIASLCCAGIFNIETRPIVNLKLIIRVPAGEILSEKQCDKAFEEINSFVFFITPPGIISAIETHGKKGISQNSF